MGIDGTSATFLRSCAASGVDFTRTVTLGRQQLLDEGVFAEQFLAGLGAQTVESIDVSDFEGATLQADLNLPLPAHLRRRFGAVLDVGTLEHVFDVATALRSVTDLVEPGGHYVAVSPANNWPGHGFYQFSPELLYRMLSPRAGYQVRGAFVVEHRRTPRWYAVPDPAQSGGRVAWRGRFRASVAVVAQRVEIVDLSSYVPQQSDYAARWEQDAPRGDGAPVGGPKRLLWQVAPVPVRSAYEAVVRRRRERFDPRLFTRVAESGLAAHLAAA